MILETQAASLWIAAHLRKHARPVDVADEQISEFQQELQRRMINKFSGHWYEDRPVQGSAFRSLLLDSENLLVDELVHAAARHARISDIAQRLWIAGGVRMWIDPKEVVCAGVRGRKPSIVVYRNGGGVAAATAGATSPPSAAALLALHHASHTAAATATPTASHRWPAFRRYHRQQQHAAPHHSSVPQSYDLYATAAPHHYHVHLPACRPSGNGAHHHQQQLVL